MKVVFLSENVFGDSTGGVEYHMYYVAKELINLGHDVVVISPKLDDEDVVQNTTYNGVKIITIKVKSRLINLLKNLERFQGKGLGLLVALVNRVTLNLTYKQVLQRIDIESPDVVHQHDYLAEWLVGLFVKKKYPLVWTNHLGEYLFLEKYLITRFVQRLLIKNYHRIIAPSTELLPNISSSKYISNGVDTEFFYSLDDLDRDKLRVELNLYGKFVVLCPRRWAPTKGVLYLAKALKELPGNVKDNLMVIFAGVDPERYPKYVKQIESELSLTERKNYKVMGGLEHDELRKYYQAADLVVIPSLMEATSLAALEAMACGSPILATNVGGMPDVVVERETGWLVPAENFSAITERLSFAFNNPKISREMGIKGAIRVSEYFTWNKIAERTNKIYEQACKDFKKSRN